MERRMSVIGRDAPPPQEAWDTLREWSQRSTGERFRLSLRMMLPIVSAVVGVGGAALLFVVAARSYESDMQRQAGIRLSVDAALPRGAAAV